MNGSSFAFDVKDDLKRQHEFVESQKTQPDAFSLVVPEAFVQSIRDLGYKSTYTALDELIDNALQANATKIEVFLGYEASNASQKKPDFIIVADDGHGMEPDMIRLAVKWGGTHRHDDRKGLGRYGFGLPSSCVSIGRAYTVHSKVSGGSWHSVRVDIDEVARKAAAGERYTTAVKKGDPPAIVNGHFDFGKVDSGTVIVIETLDRLGSGFKTTNAFVRNMLEHAGVTYRKALSTVSVRVDGTDVGPVDPLFLDPNSRWFDETPVRAEALEPISFELAGRNGELGRVRVRASSLPYNFHLKDPDGALNPSNHNARFRILKAYNGICVTRAGRQIDCVTDLAGVFTLVNFDRFWKIEIDFDPVLDEYFGITTHKQQVVFSESLFDHLRNHGLFKLVTDLRKAVLKSRAKVKARLESKKKKERASERAMAAAASQKPRAATMSPKQAREAEKAIDLHARKQSEVTGEPVEKAKERIEEQVAHQPYKVEFESAPDGPVFRCERLGKQYRLWINTLHRFYADLYEPVEKIPGLKSKLEDLLFVIAEAELDAEPNSDLERFFKSQRLYLSQRLTDVLSHLDASGDREDESSAEMEAEEAESAMTKMEE